MNEYTDLLCRLVECRPVSSDVTAVNRAETMMLDFLEAHGICCEMEEWEGRKVLYASTRPGRVQDVLLNAHLDVVPAIEESQFTPRIADGWLHARGAGDCLGNAVCIARFLCENRDAFRAGALFTADEEIGGETTRVMAERGCGALKAVLILDGGGEEGILCAQKGILVLKMTARSHGGHSSVPWEFVNPIDLLTEAYGKLRAEWRNPASADDWRNSMAPCMISGGFAENQIPDTAEIQVAARTFNREVTDHLTARIPEVIDHTVKMWRGDYECISFHTPSTYNDEALCDELLPFIADVAGAEKVCRIPCMAGTEDFGYVGEKVPSMFVTLGVGSPDAAPMHNPNMVVDEEMLPYGAAIHANVAINWLKNNRKQGDR